MNVEIFEVTASPENNVFNKEGVFHCICPIIKEPVFLIRSAYGFNKQYTLLSKGNIRAAISNHTAHDPYRNPPINPLPVEWGWIRNLVPTTLDEVALYTLSTVDEVKETINVRNKSICYLAPSYTRSEKKISKTGRVAMSDYKMDNRMYNIVIYNTPIGTAKLQGNTLSYKLFDAPVNRAGNGMLTKFFGMKDLVAIPEK